MVALARITACTQKPLRRDSRQRGRQRGWRRQRWRWRRRRRRCWGHHGPPSAGDGLTHVRSSRTACALVLALVPSMRTCWTQVASDAVAHGANGAHRAVGEWIVVTAARTWCRLRRHHPLVGTVGTVWASLASRLPRRVLKAPFIAVDRRRRPFGTPRSSLTGNARLRRLRPDGRIEGAGGA